jgi:hypothetical protein
MKLVGLTNEELIEEFESRVAFGVSDYTEFTREFIRRLKERQISLFAEKTSNETLKTNLF